MQRQSISKGSRKGLLMLCGFAFNTSLTI
jgi:hypothetical protein